MPCFVENKQSEFKIDEMLVCDIIESMLKIAGVSEFSVNFRFTDDIEIQQFNKKFRGLDKPTDILSFFSVFSNLKPGQVPKPLSTEEFELGDIIISVQSVARDAKKIGCTLDERLKTLIAHGIAHLLGHTHETEEAFKEMQEFELKLLQAK